jgi:hypothetical protein
VKTIHIILDKESLTSPARRTLMRFAGVGILSLALAETKLVQEKSFFYSNYIFEILKSAGANHKAAVVVGDHYLENGLDAFQRASTHFSDLEEIFIPHKGDIEQDKSEYRKMLKDWISKDFLDGNLTSVDGWYITESEALYCSTLAWAKLK